MNNNTPITSKSYHRLNYPKLVRRLKLLIFAATAGLTSLPCKIIGQASAKAGRSSNNPRAIIFAGYGVPTKYVISGRAVYDPVAATPRSDAGKLANIIEAIRELHTNEIPRATIELCVDNQIHSVTADDEGLWQLVVDAEKQPINTGVHIVRARVVNQSLAEQAAANKAPELASNCLEHTTAASIAETGELYIIAESNAVVIITDHDDTLAESYITDKRALVAEAFGRNAAQVSAVPGVSAAFARAKQAGAALFICVSGSPLGFYERLRHFFAQHNLPIGPIILKNVSNYSLTNSVRFKIHHIGQIIDALPNASFVLVGDSGEKDPEIYRNLAQQHPGRIRSIAIRTVGKSNISTDRLREMTVFNDYVSDPDVLVKCMRNSHPASTKCREDDEGARSDYEIKNLMTVSN
jgi:phosphatidate phosphatase APP1